MKYIYITEEQKKALTAQEQVGGKVNSGLMCYEDAKPEEDSYELGIDGNSSFDGCAHVVKEDVEVPDLKIGLNINIDEEDWLELIFSGKKTVETRNIHTLSQWAKHIGEYVGLVKTTTKGPTGFLVGYAKILDAFPYNTDAENSVDFATDTRHCVAPDSRFGKNRCGLLLGDVHRLEPRKLKSMGQQSLRPIVYESVTDETVNPDDVDLSSFNIQKGLNPKFWEDGHLDSRIRLKLLDIADDFIDFLGIDWAEPKDIIMTGSLANFNWSKEYSDIDLHIIMDFSEIDDRAEFVDNYFYSQKQLWNQEHGDITIMGYPVEVFVQDENEEHDSSGVYSLSKDKWLVEPDRETLAKSKVSKKYIKEKVSDYMNQIDKLCYLFKKAKGSEYKLRKLAQRAKDLFDKIKEDRKVGFEKSGGKEINNLNIVFKALRRNGYIEKLANLCSDVYNAQNSITEELNKKGE